MATGDTLAKGGVRAQFPPAGGAISQEAWDKIWEDTDEPKDGSRDSNFETPGDAGSDSGAPCSDATGFPA